MRSPDICALCLRNAPLRESHIIPSFFAGYLKETSATGYLRSGDAPNLRLQDLPKERLLCDACEGRFAVLEKYFKEKVFPLVQGDSSGGLTYNSLLLRFLVSVSWRVLVIKRDLHHQTHPQLATIVDRALENWRLFLLQRRKLPGSEHHMFVIPGIPVRVPATVHEKMLHYLLRGIDATTGGNAHLFFVYCKPLRTLIFSPLVPRAAEGWINTRIHSGDGKITVPQAIEMRGFLDFLNARVAEGHSKQLSQRQSQTIANSIKRNPERALASESHKVQAANKKLRRDDSGPTVTVTR